jgi:hypothetical protein
MQQAEAGAAQVEDESSDVRQWEDLPGPALKVSHEAASAGLADAGLVITMERSSAAAGGDGERSGVKPCEEQRAPRARSQAIAEALPIEGFLTMRLACRSWMWGCSTRCLRLTLSAVEARTSTAPSTPPLG